jgi:hypothetical protein
MESLDLIRVFISYSHDSDDHKQQVLSLSNQLRDDGVDCIIDQYESSPAVGWLKWMVEQITSSDYVLIVCTPTYNRRITGEEEVGSGLGVRWEGGLITQEIYDAGGRNSKFIPVILKAEDSVSIPLFLRAITHYDLSKSDGYEDLYRRLTSQPAIQKPPLGKRKELPPKETLTANNLTSLETKRRSENGEPVDWSALTLLVPNQGGFILAQGRRIETGEPDAIFGEPSSITMEVTAEDSRTTAGLAALRDTHNSNVQVAFGTSAYLCTVENAHQIREQGNEYWRLTLQPHRGDYGASSEMAFESYSADDIAELRARRILLNETFPFSQSSKKVQTNSRAKINETMMEALVRGTNTPIQVIGSPFPGIFKAIGKEDINYFLAVCRLFGILWLRLAGVVEHVFDLDLTMASPTSLQVRFEGQRRRKYINVPPSIIQVNGVCDLK